MKREDASTHGAIMKREKVKELRSRLDSFLKDAVKPGDAAAGRPARKKARAR
jgi:hypothetical protein